MRLRAFGFAACVCAQAPVVANGLFVEAGSLYQNSHSYYGAVDTANISGRYVAGSCALGYAGTSWRAGASVPYAARSASTEYFYADLGQKITSNISQTGIGDPLAYAAKDIFGGNRYMPIISLTASSSAPVGKTELSLQAWQIRPGIQLDLPLGIFNFTWQTYAAAPFAEKSAVKGEYHTYMGSIFSAGAFFWDTIFAGIDASYTAGDFVRYDASLRLGAFASILLPVENLSLNMSGQSEVVRGDRDYFLQLAVRYQDISLRKSPIAIN